MMENPCAPPILAAKYDEPVCVETHDRGDCNGFDDVCICTWDKPLKGKIYYHPVDDDPEFLGCTKLIIPVERVQPIRPAANLTLSQEPMETTTTFQREFGRAPILDFHANKRQIPKYETPCEPISSETEYRKIYYAKQIDPAKPFIPELQKPNEGAMEQKSSYQRQFIRFDPCQMRNSKPANYAPKRPKLEQKAFVGSSTTKDTYKGHCGVARRPLIKPFGNEMDGVMCCHETKYETTQQREFIRKSAPRAHLAKYHPDPYLIKPEKADYSTPISSMKRAYIAHHDVIPVCAFVPKQLPIRTGPPMTSCTTYNDNYWHRKPEKQHGRPDWSIRRAYSAPLEEMTKDSSYNLDYKKPVQSSRTASLRPNRVLLEFGTCDVIPKETTNRAQFRPPPKGDHKGQSYMPPRVYKKTADCVDYLTTTQNAYKGVAARRRLPIEVSRLAELQTRYKDKRMANRTMYRETFGVDFFFVPAKPLSARNKERCMYDIKSSEHIDPCERKLLPSCVQHVKVA